MTTTSASEAAGAASDALAPLLRAVRLAPDPVAVWLVCREGPARLRQPRDTLAARLPDCARALPLSGYLELVVAGATAVRLVRGPCCADADEPAALADARLLAQRHDLPVDLADAPVTPPRIGRARPVLDAARLPLPRRALFAPLALTRLPSRARAERDRLLDALATLGETAPQKTPAVAPGADEPAPRHEVAEAGEPRLASAPPPGVLLAAAGCTACGVCVRGCPAEALALDETDAGRLLRQDVARCTDCGECLRLCPEGALTRAGPVSWRDVRERTVRTLATVTVVATCRRCGQPLPDGRGEAGLCPVCAYRRAHPFGSVAPPGAARR